MERKVNIVEDLEGRKIVMIFLTNMRNQRAELH